MNAEREDALTLDLQPSASEHVPCRSDCGYRDDLECKSNKVSVESRNKTRGEEDAARTRPSHETDFDLFLDLAEADFHLSGLQGRSVSKLLASCNVSTRRTAETFLPLRPHWCIVVNSASSVYSHKTSIMNEMSSTIRHGAPVRPNLVE